MKSKKHVLAGSAGKGACKRRPIEQYRRMQKLAYAKTFVPMPDRFWNKVTKGPKEECWPWVGAASDLGYGRFNIGGKAYVSPRVAWTITFGEIPPGIRVLHKCDNPRCCNPNHLFLGTGADNSRDMMIKGRCKSPAMKLTEKDICEIRQSKSSRESLAKQFGVLPSHIWSIRTRRCWRHVA
jgi:hypothetical protein